MACNSRREKQIVGSGVKNNIVVMVTMVVMAVVVVMMVVMIVEMVVEGSYQVAMPASAFKLADIRPCPVPSHPARRRWAVRGGFPRDFWSSMPRVRPGCVSI